ncbi:MAG: hypothetical protein DMG07_11505, partial [Acidobacteria bacterium]
QFGARKVYAIEPDEAIQVAREMAAANGFSDRVEFFQDVSTRVDLPEQADVIVSDLRGLLPLFGRHLPSITDARRRFLAPGGRLIPRRDTLWAAVVQAPDLYCRHVDPWDDNGYGLDMQAARRLAVNTYHGGPVTPGHLLVEPKCWATLDYTTVESPDVGAPVSWVMERAGTVHGLILWFDTTLADGVGFSNAPGAPELCYGIAFFPLSQPVRVVAGDTVTVVLRAKLLGGEYIWCWDTRVLDGGDSGRTKAQFEQSSFFEFPISAGRLQKWAADHVPKLNQEGEVDEFILSRIDSSTALGEIARRVLDRFPARFADWRDALGRVTKITDEYGL